MKTYKEIIVQVPDSDQREIIMAQLNEIGFDGFEEDGDQLKAYIPEADFSESLLSEISIPGAITINTIVERNWNAEWESSFSPVLVENFVSIRADFHEPIEEVKHEIIITTKMSFGTGHHATTWLMLHAMQDLDFSGKTVLDFGTGTGVLAILAEKMGAVNIFAIDNDNWSVDNALENTEKNQSNHIQIELRDNLPSDERYDVILANINKHILLTFCTDICKALNPGGKLLLSGILKEDKKDIVEAYGERLGEPKNLEEKNNWLMIAFNKGYSAKQNEFL